LSGDHSLSRYPTTVAPARSRQRKTYIRYDAREAVKVSCLIKIGHGKPGAVQEHFLAWLLTQRRNLKGSLTAHLFPL